LPLRLARREDPRAVADDDRLDLYDYPLDGVRIAATPAPTRDAARLLVHVRADDSTRHATFSELPTFLRAGDLLVLNDTRVVAARLAARRASGGSVEVLLHPTGSTDEEADVVVALLRPSARVGAGEVLTVGGDGHLVVLDPPGAELRRVRVEGGVARMLERGELPLPPYIERESGELPLDRERYQTVFARVPGAIAAPTAGLHFTPGLFERLAAAGIGVAHLTLHVGPGTFLPVRTALLSEHAMHEELFEIPAETSRRIAATRAAGGRIVAVGTTTTRALESAAAADGTLRAGRERTHLMIRPPWRFRSIDALITNFHLPKTTLLALVGAFAGRARLLALYSEAAELGYRFYSYGDAMLLL
jgi:S-adenosylmethionine:tRNA ribosyltransferase-isomerase